MNGGHTYVGPQQGSIPADKAFLKPVGRSLGEHPLKQTLVLFQVIRVCYFPDGLPQQFLIRIAQHFAKSWVYKHQPTFNVSLSNSSGCLAHQCSEAFLGFTQCVLSACSLERLGTLTRQSQKVLLFLNRVWQGTIKTQGKYAQSAPLIGQWDRNRSLLSPPVDLLGQLWIALQILLPRLDPDQFP